MVLDTVYWEITGNCNLSCDHCYQKVRKDYPQLNLDRSLEMIDCFAENEIKILLLTGGEPLMNSNIFEIIKKSKSYNIDTAVLTNGTLINKKSAEKLAESNPDTIQISIDGLARKHDAIRGNNVFKRIEAAIDNLREFKITPLMKLTITANNADDVLAVVKYCQKNELRLNTSLSMEIGNTQQNNIMISPEKYFRLFLDLYHEKKEGYGNINLPDFAIEEYLTHGKPISACSAAVRVAAITIDNYFLPCPFMSGLNLKKEQGARLFDKESFFTHNQNPLFRLMQKYNETEFGCPLRKFQYGGQDSYSLDAFKEYIKNETL